MYAIRSYYETHRRARNAEGANDAAGIVADGGGNTADARVELRITSYNVCYTKLLRKVIEL